MAENVNETAGVLTDTATETKEVKLTDVQIQEFVDRINTLQKTRTEVSNFKEVLLSREKDLKDVETVYGSTSTEYEEKEALVEVARKDVDDVEKKEKELSFKQSELKPVLDALTKKFEEAYRTETSKEYHIKLAAKEGDGKKVFKQLLEYLYHNVSFTPKSAANLMLLVRNMEENKAWTNSKEFDDVIILKASNVINLWRFIMDDMTGKGFYEAKTFLECWVNCGQSVSDAVREIQKDNANSRQVGSNLNLVEEEFNRSENDLPHNEEKLTTKEEVDPDVAE
jgi:hypothetical protein